MSLPTFETAPFSYAADQSQAFSIIGNRPCPIVNLNIEYMRNSDCREEAVGMSRILKTKLRNRTKRTTRKSKIKRSQRSYRRKGKKSRPITPFNAGYDKGYEQTYGQGYNKGFQQGAEQAKVVNETV